MIDWLGILLIFCSLISLGLFVFIIRYALRTEVVYSTAIFTFIIGIGLMAWAVLAFELGEENRALWSNIAYLCSLLAFPILIHIFLQRTDSDLPRNRALGSQGLLFAPALIQLAVHYLAPEHLAPHIDLLFMLGWLALTLYVWVRVYRRSYVTSSDIMRNQMEFMLSAFFVVLLYDLMVIFIILYPGDRLDFSFLYGIAMTVALINTVRGIIKYQMVTGIEIFFRNGLILMVSSAIAVTVFIIIQLGVLSVLGELDEAALVLISALLVVLLMLSINPINHFSTRLIEKISPALKWQESNIKEVFVILSSGLVVAHCSSYEAEEEIDRDLVGGMLSAIQNFVQEAFQASEKETLRSLSMGDIRMLIEHHGEIAVVVLFTGFEARELRDDLAGLSKSIDLEYGTILRDWSGSQAEVLGIQAKLDHFIESA